MKKKKPVIKAFKGLSAQMFPKMVDALRQHAPEKFKGFKQDVSKKFGGTVKRKRPIDGIAQRGRTRAK